MTPPRRKNNHTLIPEENLTIRPSDIAKVSPPQSPDMFGNAPTSDKDVSHASGTTPEQADKSHYRADTDSSQQSLHHTLGTSRNQASAGNHIHDGVMSPKLGLYQFDTTPGNEGEIIPTLALNGSKGGNAALTNLIAMLKNFIDFTDNTT